MSKSITLDDAIETCRKWLEYNEMRRIQTKQIMTINARLQRGEITQVAARRALREVEGQQPKVYDGARLEPAVRRLLKEVTDD